MNNFHRPRNARTYELKLRVQRNLQRPRNAVNSSGLALSRALYDMLLLAKLVLYGSSSDRCVCWFTAVVLATRLQDFHFCMGFPRGITCFCRQIFKLRLRGLSTWAGSRVICTATNYDYRVHSQALDNSCGTSAPVSEVLLGHHLCTARPRSAETNNHVPHVDVPNPPPLPPCDYLAAVRLAVSNAYEYTSDICIHSLTLKHSRRDCLRTCNIVAVDLMLLVCPVTCDTRGWRGYLLQIRNSICGKLR